MSAEKRINPLIPIFVIPIAGLVLLNLAFALTACIRYALFLLYNPTTGDEPFFMPRFFHVITPLIFMGISYLVLRNKRLKDIYKATFSVVPTAVLLVYTGIYHYNWPLAVYIVSGLILAAIFFYLYRTKRHWMYYYAVSLISLALLYMQIRGIDI